MTPQTQKDLDNFLLHFMDEQDADGNIITDGDMLDKAYALLSRIQRENNLVYVVSVLEYINGSPNDDIIEIYRNESDAIKRLDELFKFYCERYNVKELSPDDYHDSTAFDLEDLDEFAYEVHGLIKIDFIK